MKYEDVLRAAQKYIRGPANLTPRKRRKRTKLMMKYVKRAMAIYMNRFAHEIVTTQPMQWPQ